MFERYTEKARRVIFFGRYEASQFGSAYIETEHILLGLLREDKTLTRRFLGASAVEGIRKEVEQHTTKNPRISTSVDLPVSNECKRVLAYAAEEAERLAHKYIGTEHLLLGLLREEKSFAAHLLNDLGVHLDQLRADLSRHPNVPVAEQARAGLSSAKPSTTLMPVKPLHPLIGRETELDRVIHVLGRYGVKNPVLVGELGVGKRTIVGGLVECVRAENTPRFLAERPILELHLPPWGATDSAWFDRFHEELSKAAEQGAILLVDELHIPSDGVFWRTASHLQEILKRAVVGGQVQVISLATPAGYAKSIADHGWLEACFQPMPVVPADEVDSITVLRGIKDVYEKFHSVHYSDDALVSAVAYASACIPGRHLPGKAVDVMDEAGSFVKLRHPSMPDEIVEVEKRIRFIASRLKTAVENHGFEKARFYSREDHKERENLALLREKYKIDEAEKEASALEVTRADVESVVARWTGASVEIIRKTLATSGKDSKPDASWTGA